MSPFLGEVVGTFLLILLGNGVVANLLLRGTKGEGEGFLAITVAWGAAVFVAVFVSAAASGAHLNPAVTLGLAVAGKFEGALVPLYLAGQLLGAFLGAVAVWLHYRPHYAVTEDADAIRATFCTAPAIRDTASNLFSETLGTFVLVYAVLYITGPVFGDNDGSLGSLDALPVALVVLVIGLGLGGTTGYAINPARDLGPRLAHALLPIRHKTHSDWPYAWIPVVGPLLGGALAAALYLAV